MGEDDPERDDVYDIEPVLEEEDLEDDEEDDHNDEGDENSARAGASG